MAALDRGWIPRGVLHNDPRINSACAREDNGEFKCVLKKGQIDKTVRDAVAYVFHVENITTTPHAQQILNMTGDDLQKEGEKVLGKYFDDNRHMGATCDFGGVAMLIEENRTLSDDDSIYYNDDEYFFRYEVRGPAVWKLALGGVGLGIVGALLGFVLAMHYNQSFNERVRKSRYFQPIARSQNSLIRSSLSLGGLQDFEERVPLNDEKGEDSYGGPLHF